MKDKYGVLSTLYSFVTSKFGMIFYHLILPDTSSFIYLRNFTGEALFLLDEKNVDITE